MGWLTSQGWGTRHEDSEVQIAQSTSRRVGTNLDRLHVCAVKNARRSDTALPPQLQSNPSNLALSSTSPTSHTALQTTSAVHCCESLSRAVYHTYYCQTPLATPDQHIRSRRIQTTPYRTAMHSNMSSSQET